MVIVLLLSKPYQSYGVRREWLYPLTQSLFDKNNERPFSFCKQLDFGALHLLGGFLRSCYQ